MAVCETDFIVFWSVIMPLGSTSQYLGHSPIAWASKRPEKRGRSVFDLDDRIGLFFFIGVAASGTESPDCESDADGYRDADDGQSEADECGSPAASRALRRLFRRTTNDLRGFVLRFVASVQVEFQDSEVLEDHVRTNGCGGHIYWATTGRKGRTAPPPRVRPHPAHDAKRQAYDEPCMDEKSFGGTTIPALGFGTYRLQGETCENAVRDALELGYRHIDTAEFYDNHEAVGRGIEAASVDREDVFLTTKLWKTNLEADAVHSRARDFVEALGVDAVDLLLVHWPNESVPIEETIEAMNEVQRDGLARAIGVSNFSVPQLDAAMEASATPIVTNQVQYHPLSVPTDLLEFAADDGPLITAYSPLGKGAVATNGTLQEIGGAHDKTPAQVALRWLVQQDPVIAIPKAESRDHRYENSQIFDFELTDAEMRAIFDLSGGISDSLAKGLGI